MRVRNEKFKINLLVACGDTAIVGDISMNVSFVAYAIIRAKKRRQEKTDFKLNFHCILGSLSLLVCTRIVTQPAHDVRTTLLQRYFNV